MAFISSINTQLSIVIYNSFENVTIIYAYMCSRIKEKKKEPCRGTENDLFILCIVLVVCYIQKLSLYMKLNF